MVLRDNPGVIAPPPLLYAGALGLGLAIDFLLVRRRTKAPRGLSFGLGLLLLAGAGTLIAGALRGFRRADTKVEPWLPSTAVVTTGVYRLTRNPIYIALALIYLAVAVAAESVVALMLLFPLLIVVRYGVIAREERYLEAKFGDEYRRYKATVRRWV
ncbi:MAG: isoprenylcysteine carboxylmethyltransferase family protein [Pseudomonadota bacterium]|nr:isoprenylcysteine carboxylmethyltransferase family protein [Pseudomonadota bacterium]